MARSHVLELICVYDATVHGGLVIVPYVAELFSKPCSLPELTTLNDHPHPSWQQYLAASPVPITCLAKNAVVMICII